MWLAGRRGRPGGRAWAVLRTPGERCQVASGSPGLGVGLRARRPRGAWGSRTRRALEPSRPGVGPTEHGLPTLPLPHPRALQPEAALPPREGAARTVLFPCPAPALPCGHRCCSPGGVWCPVRSAWCSILGSLKTVVVIFAKPASGTLSSSGSLCAPGSEWRCVCALSRGTDTVTLAEASLPGSKVGRVCFQLPFFLARNLATGPIGYT